MRQLLISIVLPVYAMCPMLISIKVLIDGVPMPLSDYIIANFDRMEDRCELALSANLPLDWDHQDVKGYPAFLYDIIPSGAAKDSLESRYGRRDLLNRILGNTDNHVRNTSIIRVRGRFGSNL